MTIPIFPDAAGLLAGAEEVAANLAAANRSTLRQRAVNAIAANDSFLAAAAGATFPLTVAEQTALVGQVAALTRQANALIRLAAADLAGDLSDT